MYQTLQALIHPDVGRMRLGMDLEADLSGLPLDEPIPPERIPASANLHKAYFEHILGLIREGLTLRQLYLRYERGNKTIRGTPKQVADHMEAWFTGGAADGFMLTFSLLPLGMEDFIAKVVPELQRRGLVKREWAGRTLRENVGLARPESRHAAQR
jgi:alkanesulfonate monooxygenase SsuD/methylene tetrahydromethanopterin reductase-like flavin-dependent oxidoreductase (luciferase family)